MRSAGFFFLCFYFFTLKAQVPSFGEAGRTDLASWNLMWYGHAVYGSSNKSLQRKGIGEVLRNSRVDIWFFQEICDTQDFSDLLMESGPFQHVYASYWQTQKTVWVWDSTQWMLLGDSMVLKDYSQDFAGGRLPLLAVLKARNSSDTLFLLGVHLKAHTGTDPQKEEAWNNRKASAKHLLDWQEGLRDRKVIIAGDWNDGIDKSLFRDTLSPFVQLRAEGMFLLEKQVLAGERTWYYGSSCIDHIWANSAAQNIYHKESAQILRLDWYFASYPEEISDHFPVFAAFEQGSSSSNVPVRSVTGNIWPNPSRGSFYMDGFSEFGLIQVYDQYGKSVPFEVQPDGEKLRIYIAVAGIYSLFIEDGGQVFVYRLVVNP